MSISNNIVARCVFSRRMEEDDDSNKFGQLSRRAAVLLSSFCVGDMFPYLKWMDVLTGLIPNIKAVFGELDEFLDQMIEEHTALKDRGDIKKDFTSIILQLQRDGLLEFELTRDNIKAVLLVLISTLSFFLCFPLVPWFAFFLTLNLMSVLLGIFRTCSLEELIQLQQQQNG